jgi:outer membrane murein-binding lipoprotein Lpp
MDHFLGFLTPARRQAIYSLVAVGVGALLVFGVVTEDQVTTTVQAIAAAIAALTALMAAINTNRKSQ